MRPQETLADCSRGGGNAAVLNGSPRLQHPGSIIRRLRLAYGKEFLSEWPAAEVLHIGDHDPSGVHVFSSLAEDVRAICDEHAVDVTFTRLAVTPEQIAASACRRHRRNQATRAASTAKRRSRPRRSRLTCWRKIAQQAIDDRLDETAWQQVLAAEEHAKVVLLGKFGDI
jgi:hypothetical protein